MLNHNNNLENKEALLQNEILTVISYVKKGINKAEKKIKKQEEEYLNSKKYLLYSQIADSLLANAGSIKKGISDFKLLNIHTQKDIVVKLNPALNVFENAEIYYKKSKKLKRGLPIIEDNLKKSKEELAKLLEIKNELENITKIDTKDPHVIREKINSIKNILIGKNIIQQQKGNKQTNNLDNIPYRFFVIDNWKIYVGKNDIQNDELTTKFSNPWDIWMHVNACPGSHLILKREKKDPMPTKEVLVKAAAICAWFSKAKHTSYAEVIFCEARYVHKKKGLAPGQVIVDKYKTLRVNPASPQELFKTDMHL
jgi:predicted ribosome quality control (RQC) complex YloA/Tae2 family protein